MKKIFFILCFSLFFYNSYSQTGWYRVSDSIPNFQIYKIQFTSANIGYAVGAWGCFLNGGILKTTNAGVSWRLDTISNFQPVDISFVNDNTGYLLNWGEYYCEVLKTTNGGLNWVRKDSVRASIFKVKFIDENTGIVTYKYSYARKTTDGGNTWTDMYGMRWQEPTYIWCFDAGNWIVANGTDYFNRTTNGGLNWISMDIGFPIYTLFFINSSTGYSTTDYGRVYKTTNSGYNWCMIDSLGVNTNLGGCTNFVSPDTGFISAYRVYKTTNAGFNWIVQKLNSDNYFYSMSFVNSKTGYAAGDYGIIYKTTTGGDVYEDVTIPDRFSLYQNYPNPFNSSTIIKFDIPNSSYVKISVYDISGRRIVRLVNGMVDAGSHNLTWSSANYASGIYFCKMETEKFTKVIRMISVK